MPMYMDVHRNLKDLTPEKAREAHEKDVEAQEKHGVEYLKYWYDLEKGSIFCLVNAPDEEAAAAVHREAHGLVADEIHEVEEGQ